MAGRFGDHDGGILSILIEFDSFEDALRFDLLRLGIRLEEVGMGRVSWVDIRAVIRSSPRDSAYVRAKVGADVEWTLDRELLAGLVDVVVSLRWMLSGGKGQRPKPIKRPSTRGEQQTFGVSEGFDSVEEFEAWWAEQAV